MFFRQCSALRFVHLQSVIMKTGSSWATYWTSISLCRFLWWRHDSVSLTRLIQRISARQLYRKRWSSHSCYLPAFWWIVWLFQRRPEQIWPHYIEQVACEFNTIIYSFAGCWYSFASQIENEEVLRILIDHHNIEKTLLAPTLIEGNRLMDDLLNKNVVQHVTVHCADLMTTSGTKSYAIPSLNCLRSLILDTRNRHSGPTNKYRGNPLFTADVGSEIAYVFSFSS